MQTYLYNVKTEEVYVNFKNTLDLIVLEYHELNLDKDNFNRWFIIDCIATDATLLKDKGYHVTLDDTVLTTC